MTALADQIAYLNALESLTHDEQGRVFPDEMFDAEDVMEVMHENK